MSKKTEFALEMRKLRHRHIPLLFLMVFALITAWTYWCIHDLDASRLNDVSAMVFTNLLLMNTILCPIVLAALASRMCDMEQMGNTYKWLCTHAETGAYLPGKSDGRQFLYHPVHSHADNSVLGYLTAIWRRRRVPFAGIFYNDSSDLSLHIYPSAEPFSQVYQSADAHLYQHRRYIYRTVFLVLKQVAAALSDTMGILCVAVQCGIYL